MRTKHLLIILGFLVLALVCNDIEDTLVHHYDTSVFAPLGHDSYFYPDWTRLYVDGNNMEKTFIGEWMPFLLDAWHGFKVIRWLAIGTAIIIMIWSCGFITVPWLHNDFDYYVWDHSFWRFYGIGIMVWSMLVWLMHKLFYGWLLR